AFALTFVRSDAKRAATLAVSSDESVHAWVNGKLVLARDVRRSLGFDDDRVAIELDEGWNAILLELSESDGEWRFSARLEGADGAPLSGIEEGSPPEDDLAALKDSSVESPQNAPPRARDAEGSALPGGIDPQDSVLATLQSRIEKDAGDARAWYLLGALLRARDAHDEGEHPDTDALKKAVALDPELTIAHLELAQSLRRESRIAAERDDNSWRLALIDAAERGSAAAALTLAEHYVSSFANLTRSEEWMRRALELSPEHPAAILLRGRLEASRGFFRAQERAVSEAERIAPELPSVLLERAAILERHGRNADALAILERLWREDRTSRAARDRLVRLLVDSGRVDDGLAILEE
ncbi:MAG TPA: tetratricopeptide repeat protein, partial [Planctomycetota bacterium]|nr:tetratricopeptide repeat protein [Planctomycetota bacterium]